MSWARFDDRYHGNRKVRRAWRRHPRAVALHVMAITYCAQHETDGLVDAEWIEDQLPATAERRRVLEVLVDVGLFELAGDDYRVHDYLDYNPSSTSLAEQRRKDAERKSRARRSDSETRPPGHRPDTARSPVDPSRARALPGPSRPVPEDPPGPPPSGGRQRTGEAWKNDVVAWAEAVGVSERNGNGNGAGESNVVRAYRQAEPWRVEPDDAAEHYRGFASRLFSRVLVVQGP